MSNSLRGCLAVILVAACAVIAFFGGRGSNAVAAGSDSSAGRFVECSNVRSSNSPWRTSVSKEWKFSADGGADSYVSAEGRRFFPERGDECAIKGTIN